MKKSEYLRMRLFRKGIMKRFFPKLRLLDSLGKR
jgi:hypothetical protein